MKSKEKWLTFEEAGNWLGVSHSTVRRWAKESGAEVRKKYEVGKPACAVVNVYELKAWRKVGIYKE